MQFTDCGGIPLPLLLKQTKLSWYMRLCIKASVNKRVLNKALLSEPSHCIQLQITVWLAKPWCCPPSPKPSHAEHCGSISSSISFRGCSTSPYGGRFLLIRGAEWKPIRHRVPLASSRCLPDLKVMPGEREPQWDASAFRAGDAVACRRQRAGRGAARNGQSWAHADSLGEYFNFL